MKQKLFIGLAGGFGGISPNLLGLAVRLTQKNAAMPEFTFLFGIMIFGVMGAAISLIWNEVNFKKAFYLGIGLPSLIQLSVGNATQSDQASVDIGNKAPSFGIVGKLFAQDSTQQTSISGRKISITSNVKEFTEMSILFISEDKSREEKINVKKFDSETMFEVPDYAKYFYIMSGLTTSSSGTLSTTEADTTIVEVYTVDKFGTGFLESLGVKGVAKKEIKLKTLKK